MTTETIKPNDGPTSTERVPGGDYVDRFVRLYRCVVADPPWRYKNTMAVTGNAPGRTRQNGRSKRTTRQ